MAQHNDKQNIQQNHDKLQNVKMQRRNANTHNK